MTSGFSESDVNTVDISVIVPVGARHSAPGDLYLEYRTALTSLGRSFEMIFIMDGPRPSFEQGLRKVISDSDPVTIIGLSRFFGESAAIMTGAGHATGRLVMTLPAYHQVESTELSKLVEAIEGNDMVVVRRWPRFGSAIDRVRRATFHSFLGFVIGRRFRDLGCGVRILERGIFEKVHLYGEQHRFFAPLADHLGFRVVEVNLRQSALDRNEQGYSARDYVRSFLDLFTVFFLMRFTKRPLRFFGTTGALIGLFGSAIVCWIVFERLFFGMPMAERPALMLASLLVVLGLQLFGLGLLGELIIFTHARNLRDFQIERLVRYTD